MLRRPQPLPLIAIKCLVLQQSSVVSLVRATSLQGKHVQPAIIRPNCFLMRKDNREAPSEINALWMEVVPTVISEGWDLLL
ncbi:hypothetical protein BT69DRAFT_1286744 [Atractiella rhizophila]|nr:hypothetical protein BT69DRAFT_1286744 [Atractiella rhizophila]